MCTDFYVRNPYQLHYLAAVLENAAVILLPYILEPCIILAVGNYVEAKYMADESPAGYSFCPTIQRRARQWEIVAV
jgi:hypothetical protein